MKDICSNQIVKYSVYFDKLNSCENVKRGKRGKLEALICKRIDSQSSILSKACQYFMCISCYIC